MPGENSIELLFPVAGRNRRFGYQVQPPYSTIDELNVRPDDTFEGRERGGSRPGLRKVFSGRVGSGGPIRLLSSVEVGPTGGPGVAVFADEFDHVEWPVPWEAPYWANGLPRLAQSSAYAVEGDGILAACRTPLNEADVTVAYVLRMQVLPTFGGDKYNGVHEIYANWAPWHDLNSTIRLQVRLRILWEEGEEGDPLHIAGVSRKIVCYDGNSVVYSSDAIEETVQPGILELLIDQTQGVGGEEGDRHMKGYWRGQELFSLPIMVGAFQNGFGFGLDPIVIQADGFARADWFQVQYATLFSQTEASTMLVGSADGQFHVEREPATLTQLETQTPLSSDKPLQAVSFQQKLYIADYSPVKAVGSDGEVAEDNEYLTLHSDDTDFTAAGIIPYSDVVSVTKLSQNVRTGRYKIVAVGDPTANDLTVADPMGGSGSCTFSIETAPKVYDPSTNELSIWTADTGEVPLGNPLICQFFGRIVLAGNPAHAWWMSAVNNADDWYFEDTFAGNPQGARYGQNSDIGDLGVPITALIPFGDDYLLFGGRRSLWLQRGSPAFGTFDNKSREIGIYGATAAAWTPDGYLAFLTDGDGLYLMAPGAEQFPQSRSRESIPTELLRLPRGSQQALLAYDVAGRGLHIFLTSAGGTTGQHYWYDWEAQSFWSQSLQTGHEPTAVAYYDAVRPNDRGTILGCRDGYIRAFDPYKSTDDGSEFSSHVVLGPIRLGGNAYMDGMLMKLQAVLGEDSGPIRWEVYGGNGAEEAYKADAAASGVWSRPGLNPMAHPRVRANTVFVKLMGVSRSGRWTLEQLTLTRRPAGRLRLL